MDVRDQDERLVQRLRASLRLPRRRKAWLLLAAEAAWLLPLLLLLGWGGGLAHWDPTFDETLLNLALLAVVAPALGEELLFRAAMLPRPRAASLPLRHVALATTLFVAWHPIQIFVHGPHWAETMFNPWFLAAVAASGVALARLYWKTESIWPSVVLHWLIVVGWKALLSGPSPWVAA
jgi:uncharacterized protein